MKKSLVAIRWQQSGLEITFPRFPIMVISSHDFPLINENLADQYRIRSVYMFYDNAVVLHGVR
jgi:hypothetical protein